MLVGSEHRFLKQCFENSHVSGGGEFARKCELLLEQILRAPKALLTTSCTHALEMAALLLDVNPNDEIIVPSFTFPSTANAFVLRGARPVFADIRPDTLNLDEAKLESLITPRTKAIILVHYAGIACEMRRIQNIAARHNLIVIEDNAHGLFGQYHGQMLGTFGALATQSFHETKNISCGEGGALVVNDRKFIERAEIIREKGTNRNAFFRGEIDKYSWVDVGSSYVMSDLLAAFLYANLQSAKQIQAARQKIWRRYDGELREWAEENNIGLPVVPVGCEPAYHLFYLILPSPVERERFLTQMKQAGVQAIFHYQPLHLSKMGQSFGGRANDCPVTEVVADCLVRLPFFNSLSEAQQSYVIQKVEEFQTIKHQPYACRELVNR